MTNHSFESGTSEINGVRVDRVLRASTRHMPDLREDLSPWHWGEEQTIYGFTWVFAYEEDCEIDGKPMPEWLLNLCYKARDTYGCNWVLLDPDAEPIPDLPTYDH